MSEIHSVNEHKNEKPDRRERAIGAVLLVLGLAIVGGALMKIPRESVQWAQANSESSTDKSNAPAEAMPGGTRPTTPAPEPARPQATPGQTTGSAPSATQDRPSGIGTPLPPAPAEKTAPPINTK